MKFQKTLLGSCLILIAAFLIPASAQPPPQEPVRSSLEVTRELQKETLETPLPYRDKIKGEGTILELSLREAVRLALTNNLDIAIENFNEEFTRESIIQTRGFYDPVMNFTVGWTDNTQPTVSVLEAGQGQNSLQDQNFIWNTTYSQNIPTGGGYQVSFNNFRSATNNSFSTLNPAFGTDFSFNIRQPLWRGFRQTNTERQLKVSNLDMEIDDLSFESRVADVIQRVKNQYWELVFAIENYETRRQSMQLAIIQHSNNQKRVRIGVSAPIEITSSRAEVAIREQDMIFSEVNIIQAQNALRRLLAPDPKDPIWNFLLVPTDRPQTRKVQQSLQQAIDVSLERRPELKQIELQLDQNQVDRRFLKRETKPNVDLRFTYTSRARTGQTFDDLDGDGIADPVPLGNLGNSIFDTFKFNFTSWAIFADVRIPLRNRTNDALLAQVGITERLNLSRFKNSQQQIIVEVRNAYEGLKTQEKRLEATRLARRLSEEQLRGEDKRFRAGLSTNFQVLRFQRDLTNALAQELRATIDYEQALTSLERATYTIIEDSDVVLARQETRQ